MQKKNEQTMNRIFDSAENLFSKKDFHEVKMEEIAKNANVGKGTIYTYFKSKEDLLFKCLMHNLEDHHKKFSEVVNTDKDFKTTLKDAFVFMFDFFKRKSALIQRIMGLMPQLKLSESDIKYAREMFHKALDVSSSFFQRGIDEGIIINIMTSRQIAIVFQKMFDFNVMFAFYGEPEMSVEDCYRFFTKTFFRQE
ncbi:MAG: TetR/AcrR family transcriptional regulator [Candidatus Riflebacteria bacterium]|nr:TetR/AcrR family transcriptional regulator [Candidatus Riflebacteria bacterium]